MITRKLIVAACIAAAGIAAVADAQPTSEGRHGPGFERMRTELGLSDEQMKQLDCATPGQGREIFGALSEVRKELNDLIRDPGADDERILAQFDKLMQLERDWNSHRLEKILAFRRVLSAEQLQKLIEIRRNLHPGAGTLVP